jgi:hypothetical protein
MRCTGHVEEMGRKQGCIEVIGGETWKENIH